MNLTQRQILTRPQQKHPSLVQNNSRFFEALTGEISHHPIVGLLSVLVVLLHLWLVILLMQPSDIDKETKLPKVMEVALISEPSQKAEAAPTIPPPKKVPPKKKAIKPPVKKEPIIRKKMEQPKPVIVDEPTPTQPSASDSLQKSAASVSPAASSNQAIKSGKSEAPNKGINSGIVELGCPRPNYPMRAMSRHIEGWVKIEVTISAAGTVTNAKVTGAEPPGIFDDAALDATKKCKFKPKIVNGTAVTQRGSKVSRFKIAN